jgi:hypothetical protein
MSDDKPAAGSAPEPVPGTAAGPGDATVEQGAVPPTAGPTAQPAPARQRFVERVWGLKAVIAVALASVIIGGLGGAALAKGGDRQGGNDRMGFGHGNGHGFGQGFGRGPNGQGPPGHRNGRMQRMPGPGQQGPGFGQGQDDSQG